MGLKLGEHFCLNNKNPIVCIIVEVQENWSKNQNGFGDPNQRKTQLVNSDNERTVIT